MQACKDPDVVRRSAKNKKSSLFYAVCDRIRLGEKQEVPFNGYLAVVVAKERWIQTLYFTKKIKAGEELYAKNRDND